MKDRSSKKANIISFRMSDEEREIVQQLMESKNKRASSIMREAFNLFREQWEMTRRMETPIQN